MDDIPVKQTAENGIGKGTPGPGRPKGSSNKVTSTAKDVIAQTAERLGGVDRLVAWAQEDAKNEHAYWTQIYTKLLPLQHANDPDNPFPSVVHLVPLQ